MISLGDSSNFIFVVSSLLISSIVSSFIGSSFIIISSNSNFCSFVEGDSFFISSFFMIISGFSSIESFFNSIFISSVSGFSSEIVSDIILFCSSSIFVFSSLDFCCSILSWLDCSFLLFDASIFIS